MKTTLIFYFNKTTQYKIIQEKIQFNKSTGPVQLLIEPRKSIYIYKYIYIHIRQLETEIFSQSG